jgi:purine nucleosidase
MATKVIIDTDTGIDDAMAVVYALLEPEIEVLALTSVFGNVSVDLTTRNTLVILDVLGRTDIPVAQGAAKGLIGEPSFAPYVHGDDGVGNAASTFGEPSSAPLAENAASLIVRMAREQPGEIVLVPIGPLTNIALALQLEPRLPELVRGLVWMGGVINGPGNVTAVAEADAAHDPEAAQMVFEADWPLTMVGLDVTDVTLMREEHFERLAMSDTVAASYLAAITPFYMDFYSKVLGFRACAMHSALTVAIVAHPDLVLEEVNLPVAVELQGSITRGMTVADRRPGSEAGARELLPAKIVRIPLRVDEERFMDTFLRLTTGSVNE